MVYKTIRELHEAYLDESTSVSQVVEQALLSFTEHKELNTAITVISDYARQVAEMLDRKLAIYRQSKTPLPPLFGVPLGVKDILQLDGTRMTCASRIMEDYQSPFTATAVQRLIDAGAVPVAKLNCDEFAMGSSNENSAFGPVRNPVHAEYVPGGSSGGSAAAIAAKQCLISLGTDTGGSIRQPAALCGVVGIKPTWGRVSRYGASALASSLDQIGPFAGTVYDAAMTLQVMAGSDEHDLTASHRPVPDLLSAARKKDVAGVRVGIPKEYFLEGMDTSVKNRILEAAEKLREAGAKIVDVSLPHAKYALAAYYLIQPAECSSNLARYDGIRYAHRDILRDYAPSHAEATPFDGSISRTRMEFGPEVRRRLMLGAYTLSAGYFEQYYRLARKVRRVLANDFEKAFAECDVILGPTSPTVAWKLGEKADDPLTMYLSDIYTVSVNLAGLPALSVPVGSVENQHGDRLPVGAQLIAPCWQEERIVHVGAVLENMYVG